MTPPKCAGKTKAGKPCSRFVSRPGAFCPAHDPQNKEAWRAQSSLAGKRSKSESIGGELIDEVPDTKEELAKLNANIIKQVFNREMSYNHASTLNTLIKTQWKFIEELEEGFAQKAESMSKDDLIKELAQMLDIDVSLLQELFNGAESDKKGGEEISASDSDQDEPPH